MDEQNGVILFAGTVRRPSIVAEVELLAQIVQQSDEYDKYTVDIPFETDPPSLLSPSSISPTADLEATPAGTNNEGQFKFLNWDFPHGGSITSNAYSLTVSYLFQIWSPSLCLPLSKAELKLTRKQLKPWLQLLTSQVGTSRALLGILSNDSSTSAARSWSTRHSSAQTKLKLFSQHQNVIKLTHRKFRANYEWCTV